VIEVRAAAKDGGGLAVSFSDITERHRAETLRQLLLNELNHRVKNTLAVVQGLAAQSFKTGVDPDAARRSFEGRLRALAAAHDLLTAENWVGASLRSVISEAVHGAADPSRLSIDGPDLQLPPQTAVTLALAIHELSTNAVKHGALGSPDGRVHVGWAVTSAPGTASPRLRLDWVESGGPPVAPPARRGFGSRMLEQGLAGELGGTVRLDFAAQGLRCHIDAPLPGAGKDTSLPA
jgi:two-component sensor histidine kinase